MIGPTTTIAIPYKFPYPVPDAARDAVLDVLNRRIHYFGPYTHALESKLASLAGVRHAAAVGSGSGAILLTLHACEIEPGDEVIVPANVYAGVTESVLLIGGVPIMVDVEEDTANISADGIAAVLSSRTRAVVVQHTYGHVVDMDPVTRLARDRGVAVIEDAAHAMGARYNGRPAGGLSDVALFAFSNKGISACGVGGAVVCDDPVLAERARLRRYHGRRGSYETHLLGYNLRLTEFVAAVASLQLGALEGWNARRQANAACYSALLDRAGLPLRRQAVRAYAHHSYLHFVIRARSLQERDALRAHLAARGVETAVHYTPPSYLHEGISGRLPYRRGHFPVTEALADELLSLPCHPAVGEAEVAYVVEQIEAFYDAGPGDGTA
jgi:dTDP-4-amino-4,6-dideoxygalactose transaminase